MKTYQITLPDEFAAFVDRLLAEKKWDTANDLVTYALAQVREELDADTDQDPEALKSAIQTGVDQAERGETAPLDTAAVWARVQARLAEEQEAAHGAGDAHRAG